MNILLVKIQFHPKAFEKQIKTIKDQGEKQINALENLKDTNKQVVSINDDYEDKLLHLK